MATTQKIVCLVHGGAGALPDSGIEPAKEGTSAAAQAGYQVLLNGGTAIDAVEAAVRVLEDNPRFNAGTGSVLNREGHVEMDCLIMDGKDLKAGTATMVRQVKNPVSLARLIMEQSPHVFLGGAAADAFGRKHGLEMVDNGALITEARREQLKRTLEATHGATKMVSDPLSVLSPFASGATVQDGVSAALASPAAVTDMAPPGSAAAAAGVDAGDHDTVGAVAVDAWGNVACATSTGGLTGKWVHRIGDTPVVGAGGYADNETGAVSTTGTGEYIMRFNLARRVCEAYARLKAVQEASTAAEGASATNGSGAQPSAQPSYSKSLATAAVEETLQKMKLRLVDPGEGLIFVTPDGDVGVGHSSHRMSWACVTAEVAKAPAAAAGSGGPRPLQPRNERRACGVQLQEGAFPGVRVVAPQ